MATKQDVTIVYFVGKGGHKTILGVYSSQNKATAAIQRHFKKKALKPGMRFVVKTFGLDCTNPLTVDVIKDRLV